MSLNNRYGSIFNGKRSSYMQKRPIVKLLFSSLVLAVIVVSVPRAYSVDPTCFGPQDTTCADTGVEFSKCADQECDEKDTDELVKADTGCPVDPDFDIMKTTWTYACPDNSKEAIDQKTDAVADCVLAVGKLPEAKYEKRNAEKSVCYRTRYCVTSCAVTTEVLLEVPYFYRNHPSQTPPAPYDEMSTKKYRAFCNSSANSGTVGTELSWFSCMDDGMECENFNNGDE